MNSDRGGALFDPPVALASLSGRSDAEWAEGGGPFAGCAFLGGIALDDATRRAARSMVERDRSEFLPSDPLAFVQRQLRAMDELPIRAGVNVRSAALAPIEDAAGRCQDHDAILEINAHCRQEEMCEAGAGQALLDRPEKLCRQVEAATATGATVSVKVRAEVDGVDLPTLAAKLERAGADAVHVDAMDSEHVVGEIADATGLFVIANNEVRDAESVHEYFRYGADAVSVGRASDDPDVLAAVRHATHEWFQTGAKP
ncbi:tRNA-dihydrouridine synthase [Halomicrobium sp. LC1Hm]|nr:tRNA-dihydrouridine synthase [Halomicrobium sp. LC1Hm]QGA82964.1 tRNA-dihydrouridine synthase [Halomicrobium sp. LC1Hm]